MTAVQDGRGVSVYEMMQLVGRAGVATRMGSADEITAYLRSLGPEELIEEFHRAVATLSSRNLLSKPEQAKLADYARDWVQSLPMSI